MYIIINHQILRFQTAVIMVDLCSKTSIEESDTFVQKQEIDLHVNSEKLQVIQKYFRIERKSNRTYFISAETAATNRTGYIPIESPHKEKNSKMYDSVPLASREARNKILRSCRSDLTLPAGVGLLNMGAPVQLGGPMIGQQLNRKSYEATYDPVFTGCIGKLRINTKVKYYLCVSITCN